MRRLRRQHGLQWAAGLTLIELVVVMAVVAILLAVAASPSIRGMMSRQRVSGVHAELLTDLRLARSEAAQRGNTPTKVAVSFGNNADLTCYAVHVVVSGVACDCTRAPGSICVPATPGLEVEIKTAQFARSSGVTVGATSSTGPSIEFAPPQGLAAPDDLTIDVQGLPSGQLRTTVSRLGVPTVCSPDSSIRGVASC